MKRIYLKNNRNIQAIGALTMVGAMMAVGSVIQATPQAPESQEAATMAASADPEASADSVAADSISVAQILGDEATKLYKEVKFMQYEGELESKLYPAALNANLAAIKALEAADTPELEQRSRNILTDLNPVMLQGAVYCSNSGDAESMPKYARAYIDAQQHERMRGVEFKRDNQIFPTLIYNAAYGATKAGESEKAKEYFRLYLETGHEQMREQVYGFYGQACMQSGDYDTALRVLEEAARSYPTNMQLIAMAMQCCLDGGYPERLQPLLDKALILNPNDERLINIQAQVYENNGDYKNALDIYRTIAETHPNSLENTRRIATCLYNLGATYYNESIMDTDEKIASRNRRQSKAYFADAAKSLENLLTTTPSDVKYLRALGQTFAALGNREKFDDVNVRLQALGEKAIAFNDMPVMIGNGGNVVKNSDDAIKKIPTYEEFARPYIEKKLASWAQRGEFEKMEDYKTRMAGGDGVDAYNTLNNEAADAYLKEYGRKLVLTDLKRSEYDVDNETYSISTPFGETVVRVPLKNKEAEAFKAGWETVQIRAPRFIIRDNKVAIAEITYVVNGKKYTFNSDDAATYRVPSVYVDVNGILAAAQTAEGREAQKKTDPVAMIWTESDVDRDIPVTSRKSDNLFALIIANENYEKASDVFGSLHDGATMREYCTKTLGVPDHQAVLVNNATGNQVRDALAQLKRRVKGCGPDAEVIFYYAGHGLPDDATKEAFMMPVDANPLTIATLIPMKDIYRDLSDLNAASVSVFLDACFSGEGRDGATINEARGVALKAKEIVPQGNMYVLSAASAQETAMPYKEKHHGLFTYFLLKKLQESKGNASLKEISDYVIKNVRDTSNANPSISKEQNPTVATSGKMSTMWEKKKLKAN